MSTQGSDKGVMAVIAAIGVIVGAVYGSITLVEWLQETSQEPIRVEYAHRAGVQHNGVVRDFDPDKSADYYINKGLIIYSDPIVYVDVISQVDDEHIKLAPYLLVTVTSVERTPQPVDAIFEIPKTEAGGDSSPFYGTLSPELQDKVIESPQVEGESGQQFDFFTVAPGGREAFDISFLSLPGYSYRFRVGVQYSYAGEEHVVWSREFDAAMPPDTPETTVWSFKPNEQPLRREPLGSAYRSRYLLSDEEAEPVVQAQEEMVQEFRSPFEPPKQGRD